MLSRRNLQPTNVQKLTSLTRRFELDDAESPAYDELRRFETTCTFAMFMTHHIGKAAITDSLKLDDSNVCSNYLVVEYVTIDAKLLEPAEVHG